MKVAVLLLGAIGLLFPGSAEAPEPKFPEFPQVLLERAEPCFTLKGEVEVLHVAPEPCPSKAFVRARIKAAEKIFGPSGKYSVKNMRLIFVPPDPFFCLPFDGTLCAGLTGVKTVDPYLQSTSFVSAVNGSLAENVTHEVGHVIQFRQGNDGDHQPPELWKLVEEIP